MKSPQNGCFRLVRRQKDHYQNNINSWKALMFQRSTPSSDICKIKWKNIFQLHQVLHFTQAKKSVAYWGYGRRLRRKTLFANAEQDPVKVPFELLTHAVAFQDTQISGHLFASPLLTPLLPLSSSVLFPSVNLCKLSLAFATFYFLFLTLLTILGGDKQLNNINNNLLGTLINEFSLWPSCNHNCVQCKPADWGVVLTNSGAVFRLSSLWILIFQRPRNTKTSEIMTVLLIS